MDTQKFRILIFAGTAALCALCAYQWREEALKNDSLREAGLAIDELKEKLAKSENNLRGLASDIAFFKEQIILARTDAEAMSLRARNAEDENARLTANADRLAENIKTLERAVKERDAVIADADAKLKQLSVNADEVATRFNALAEQHNLLVAELNETREKLAQSYAALDETRRRLYKALGRPLPKEN